MFNKCGQFFFVNLRPDDAQLESFGQSIPTVYMKAGSAILCILIFGSTLIVSCCCPKKDSTRSQRTQRLELSENI
jgi:hypothetical protein